MSAGVYQVPVPVNEPVKSYAPGSPERAELERMLVTVAAENIEIPVVAGRHRLYTGDTVEVTQPHAHRERLGVVHQASPALVEKTIHDAMQVAPAWAAMPFEHRAAIFLKAAELLAGPWRARINAACMLGQSKTCHQAEIDAACELIDFFRFNVHYAQQIMQDQPSSPRGDWNRVDYRPLEGFVFAITPFNFLSIALNLPTAPALMGNVVLWKPANTTAVACWHMLELLREAGLPDGVISFLPGAGPGQGAVVMASEHLAGIHFTGSTGTFHTLWRGVANNLERYRTFPRLVGETGGKDFILAHPSADVQRLAVAIVRGGFEFQGQKCSAASRIYVPRSLWPEVKDRCVAMLSEMKMGDPRDFSNFLAAVIDQRAFKKISSYQALARETGTIHFGGKSDDSVGWFIEPTLVEVDNPKARLMEEEIFGPVVTTYVYDDARWDETVGLVDTTSPYALTGALFARDRQVIVETEARLRNAAGNFYINDKPTGAVVGQQPFGGARASGTDDKAGSLWNLIRWVAPRTIKENFVAPTDWRYPFLGR